MEIRKTRKEEIDQLLEIYELAKAYMRRDGNPNQWPGAYPSREILEQDVETGHSFVGVVGDEIAFTFALFFEDEPNYQKIDGSWLNSEEYATIHRIASSGKYKGTLKAAIDYAFEHCNNVRIDTHAENTTMRAALRKLDFHETGIIWLANGDPRVSFHKIKED